MSWITFQSGIILLMVAAAINQAGGIRCYVCGDSNNFPGLHQSHNSSSHLSCDEFDKSEGDQLKRFIVECAKHYQGCITQKQGNDVLRACDTIAFNDCQSANGVTYCYCNGDLCNAPGAMKLSTTSAAYIDLNKVADLTTDDEDYIDMSGDGDGNFDDFDPKEKTLIIKGNFDLERPKTLLGAPEDELVPSPTTHIDAVDNGNDYITTEDDSIHLVINASINMTNATKPAATMSTWSTSSTHLVEDDTKEPVVISEDTRSDPTASTTFSTTHVADIRKSSTRLLESNASCKLFSSKLARLIVLIACILTNY